LGWARSGHPLHCAEYFFSLKCSSYTIGSNGVILVPQKAQRFWQPLRCAEGSGSARCATAFFLAKEKAGSRYFQQ
jgi:hypothetical protein